MTLLVTVLRTHELLKKKDSEQIATDIQSGAGILFLCIVGMMCMSLTIGQKISGFDKKKSYKNVVQEKDLPDVNGVIRVLCHPFRCRDIHLSVKVICT